MFPYVSFLSCCSFFHRILIPPSLSVLQALLLGFSHWGNTWKGTRCQSHFGVFHLFFSCVKGSVLTSISFLQRILIKALERFKVNLLELLSYHEVLQYVFSSWSGRGIFWFGGCFLGVFISNLQFLIDQIVRREHIYIFIHIAPPSVQGKWSLHCEQTFAPYLNSSLTVLKHWWIYTLWNKHNWPGFLMLDPESVLEYI